MNINLDVEQVDYIVAESMKDLLRTHVLAEDSNGEFVNDFDLITSIEAMLRYFLPILEADSFIEEVNVRKVKMG